jgi:hypothetical protein
MDPAPEALEHRQIVTPLLQAGDLAPSLLKPACIDRFLHFEGPHTASPKIHRQLGDQQALQIMAPILHGQI